MHTVPTGAPHSGELHGPVRVLVVDDAEGLVPTDDVRPFLHEDLDESGVVGKMAAAQSVQVVDGWAVVWADCSLDASLAHLRVRVPQPELLN